MIDDQNSLRGDVNRFQITRWSVVLVSAQSQAPGSEKALADLCITELARAFLNKGWHERAHEPIRKALELNPNDWRANRFAADELFGTARYDEMYVSLRKCYAVNPNDSYAPNLMGYICWIVDHFQRHAVGSDLRADRQNYSSGISNLGLTVKPVASEMRPYQSNLLNV